LYNIEKEANDPDVARLASAIRHSENLKEMALDVTLIDLTNANDMVSFIQLNRIKRHWDDPKEHLKDGWDSFEEYLDHVKSDRDSKFWKEQRGQVKIGKFVKKLFKDNGHNLVDAVVEKFGNFFKALFDFENNLELRMQVVQGEDIRKWYHENNYALRKGQLSNSCMRYSSCQSFLDIYVENPQVCSLVILYSSATKTKISGRALLWKTTDDKVVMDRIYTNNDYDIQTFRKWADEKGYQRVDKDHRNWTIQLKKGEIYKDYPYMDNFSYFNKSTFQLTNNERVWPSDDWWRLQNTDGTYTEEEGVWSEYHGDYIVRDEACFCPNVDDWVHQEHAIWLEYKDIFASPEESVVYSEWYDQSFYSDDVVHSEIMNDYILTDDAISIMTNYDGDEDYIVPEVAKNSLVDVEYKGDWVKTLNRFVVLDPTTMRYHFIDEEFDNKNIKEVISEELKDIVVDKDRIKDYLLKSDFKIDTKKIKNLCSLTKIWVPFSLDDSDFVSKFIKYLLWAYPEKSEQRGGLPKLDGSLYDKSQSYLNFRNKIINFDPEFAKQLLSTDTELLKKGNNDTIFRFTKISQSFIADVFKDDIEVYKMWYKWKMC
jgi:hypothetical protein